VEDFTNKNGQRRHCQRCGCTTSFLDEFVDSKSSEKIYQCSDSDWCNEQMTKNISMSDIKGISNKVNTMEVANG